MLQRTGRAVPPHSSSCCPLPPLVPHHLTLPLLTLPHLTLCDVSEMSEALLPCYSDPVVLCHPAAPCLTPPHLQFLPPLVAPPPIPISSRPTSHCAMLFQR